MSGMLLKFCFNSLFREYGRDFITKIAVPHPLRFIRGLLNYDKSDPGGQHLQEWPGGRTALVGLGFCLKPLEPECLSRRPNHRCYYFEHHLHLAAPDRMPECCRNCGIRIIGLMALKARSSFYIMTSARDILHDIFLPSVQSQKFAYGLFGLCRYSFDPFRIGLSISRIDGSLFAYDAGACQNYRSWRQADIGVKSEQTRFSPKDFETIGTILIRSQRSAAGTQRFIKEGNVFYPEFV